MYISWFLDHNLLTTNARRTIKGSKYEDFRLIYLFKETKQLFVVHGAQGQVIYWPKKPKPTPILISPTKKLKSKIYQFFKFETRRLSAS